MLPTIVELIIVLAVSAFILYVNDWDAKRRALLTAEEREAEDADDRIEANIW